MSLIELLLSTLTTPAESDVCRVRINADTLVKPVGESPRHCQAGEVVDVSTDQFRTLAEGGGATLLGRIGPGGEFIAKPAEQAPAAESPMTPRPLPADWADLPTAFKTAWELQEQRAVFNRAIDDAHAELKKRPAHVIGPKDTQREANVRRRFEDRIEELRQKRDSIPAGPLAKALKAAGDIALGSVRDANALADKVEKLAFQIFSERVAALGLEEEPRRRLFLGSTLWVTYRRDRLSEGDLRLYPGGVVLDEPLEHMALRARRGFAAKKEINLMIERAERELAALRETKGATVNVGKRAS